MEKAAITEIQPKALVMPFTLTTETGQCFEIPADGSLGLLALGYAGLMAWREVRHHSAQMIMNTYSSSLTQPKNET
ncbi:MAG: hypothetical protein R3D00_04240 [Bacteroidia bacterium]